MHNINKRCIDCFYVKFCPNDPSETVCCKFIDHRNVIVAPHSIKDKIWFITGIHNTLAKEARIEEIHYNGDEFSYTVSTSFVTFDLQAHEVFATKEEAEKEIKHGN